MSKILRKTRSFHDAQKTIQSVFESFWQAITQPSSTDPAYSDPKPHTCNSYQKSPTEDHKTMQYYIEPIWFN